MTKQTINVGSGEFTGDGESIRSAFVKTNENFNEIYTATNELSNRFGNLTITDQTISALDLNRDIAIHSNGKLIIQQQESSIFFGKNDGGETGTLIIGKISGGTSESPTNIMSNDNLLRLASFPFTSEGYPQFNSSRYIPNSIEFVATEDYVSTSNLGSAINFYNSPIGYGEKTLSASMDGTGLVFVANTLTDIGITFADGSRLTSSNGIGGISITDFGEGFSLTNAGKIVTNKLYSTNQTQPTQHYRLELDTNGVIVLPDQSIINGSTIRGIYGTGELNYTGMTTGPDSGNRENTWMWVDAYNAYIGTDYADSQYTWKFGSDGTLTMPGSISVNSDFIVESIVDGYNSGLYFNANTATGSASILYGTQDIIVRASNNALPFKDWVFSADSTLTTPGHIIPNADLAYDLGSTSSQWRSLYVGTSTIYLGGVPVSVAGGQLTVDGSPVQATVDRISSGTVQVYLTEDGRLNFPRGSLLFNNTASVVVSLADIDLLQVLEYSTTSTDYIAADTYGNDNPYNAPYTVIELQVTPPEPLFQGDIVAGPEFPVPSTIKYAGTGSFTTTLILDSDLTGLPIPVTPVKMTVARPVINDTLTIESADGVDLVLKPGGSRNTIMHNDLIPYSQYGSSLGSPINRFKHLWMGAGTIYLQDEITNADSALTARNGQFTILGTAGLTVGEFTLVDNQIKIEDPAREIIIGTTTATGYVNFNRPVKMTGSSGNAVFDISRDGLVSVYPKQDISVSESALSIVGNAAGLQQPRNFTGTMLQITGQNGIATRVSIDSFGTGAYPVIAGRAARGTVQAPTATKANDVLFRIATQGYGDNQYVQSIGRITIQAAQDFTNAHAGTQVVIQTTPNNSNIITTSTVFDNQGIDFDGNANGGITFYDRSRQTTAFTGTIQISQISDLASGAVTSISINTDGLSGSAGPGTASINNTGVIGISGTPNQVYINTVGRTTETGGHFTLMLPQDLAPTSNVRFNDINIDGQLNFSGTATVLIPNTVEGTQLFLGSSATSISQLDNGGIVLGNSATTIASILWNRNQNAWDFDGSGIRTQALDATTATFYTLTVLNGAHFGDSNIVGDYPNAAIQIDSRTDSWSQLVFQNHSSSTFASTDFVATNELGTDTSYYIDMGINSSNYNDPDNWVVNGANDGYLYVDSGNLAVGTTKDEIVFFTGDAAVAGSIRATIDATGLNVANTVTSAGFYGPLTGDVIGNVTGNVTGNAGSVTNGVYSNQTYANPAWIGSLAGTKITGVVATATTVVNGVYTTDNGSVTNNMLAGSIANNKLEFNQITVNAGAGIGVSVASPSLGGSTTISNTGVRSITTGAGIIISTATGDIVISAAVPQGPTGYTGSVGSQGGVGFTGSAGTNGSTGYTGSVGSQGGVGFTGSAGTNGSTGFTGSQGTQGYWGSVGYVGSQGTQGYWGSYGYTGSKGVADVYVSSISAGTGTTVTTSTGAVTVYIGQTVGVTSDVTFNSVSDVAGNLRSIPIKNTGTSYTLTSADNGRVVSITTGSVTIPANVFASPYGQTISIYNNTVTSMSVLAAANVTLRLAGTLSTGTRTLVRYGVASVIAVSSNTFVISGAGLA